jgi:hypothetical protein
MNETELYHELKDHFDMSEARIAFKHGLTAGTVRKLKAIWPAEVIKEMYQQFGPNIYTILNTLAAKAKGLKAEVREEKTEVKEDEERSEKKKKGLDRDYK